MRGFFEGIPRSDVSIRGVPAKSPLFFRDLSMMLALFTARGDKASAMLPRRGLRPLLALPGRSVVGITCFEYRDTDIGPYNEVGISIGVQTGQSRLPDPWSMLRSALTRRFHGYVVDLPVNTDVALHGGLDFFNYPKFVADIRFEEALGLRSCIVADSASGEPIYSFRGAMLNGHRPWTPWKDRGTCTFHSYPEMAAEVLDATMLVNEAERAMTLRRGAFRVECSRHPRAEKLAALDLGTLLAYVYVPRAEAIMFAPRPLFDVSEAPR